MHQHQPPPQGPWYPPQQYPAHQPGALSAGKAVAIVAGFFGLIFLLGVVSALTRGPKTDTDGADITYAVSGNTRGVVHTDDGVRHEDGATLMGWLKESGWFVPVTGQRSAVSGMAWGSYGTGAAGRGRGEPLAKLTRRQQNNGFEVIVFTSKANADSTDAQEWAARSAKELSKRMNDRPVRVVIRAETVVGRGLEWTDTYFDSNARTNGK